MVKGQKVGIDVSTSMTGVTGSIYLVNIRFTNGAGTRILIDAGKDMDRYDNDANAPFEGFFFDPRTIDAVFITHPHLDHYGRLGELVHEHLNDEAKIYCTNACAALLPLALQNSYSVDMSKCKRVKDLPYDKDDLDTVISRIEGVDYNEDIVIENTKDCIVKTTPIYNAHLPGACSYLIRVSDPNDPNESVLLFSGDYKEKSALCKEVSIDVEGFYDLPVNIFIESTYGGRSETDVKTCFEEELIDGLRSNKKVIIPSISLERFQLILLMIKNMQDLGKISDNVPIYADAPLAMNFSSILEHDDRIELKETAKHFRPEHLNVGSRFSLEGPPAIYVCGGGMGHGPSQGYIRQAISRNDCKILFTCYQAENTLGRRILDAQEADEIVINGETIEKRAQVAWTGEFSGHAHQEGLMRYIKKFPNVQSITIIHGDKENRNALMDAIEEEMGDKIWYNSLDRNVFITFQGNNFKRLLSSNLISVTKKYEPPTSEEKEELKKKRKKKKHKESITVKRNFSKSSASNSGKPNRSQFNPKEKKKKISLGDGMF